MELSVIIVSYNVKHFLEQCLFSVQKAIAGMEAEVIVVDNDSKDGTIDYLQPAFPNVQFIANKENLGFGRANNLAVKLAKGKFILFLNPDTIVPEDCFTKCIAFLGASKDGGALGVKMIDGSGNFLPESKRSFPSVMTSFYKLTGLASLFPASKTFNRYALGNLDKNKNHEVDVLCGAFMMLTKEVAERTKGFDEDFFMYGEDIDLSYRLQQLGFRNYYFAETCIIHFKGESAGQQSLKHNKMFYDAMLVFVKKHYGKGKVGMFSFLLRLAILFRSAIGFVGRLFKPRSNYQELPAKFTILSSKDGMHDAERILGKRVSETIVQTSYDMNYLKNFSNHDIVFCEGGSTMSNKQIIDTILLLEKGKSRYWFHQKNSRAIIGSPSKNNSGTVIEHAPINK